MQNVILGVQLGLGATVGIGLFVAACLVVILILTFIEEVIKGVKDGINRKRDR
jgi:uncharacterized membrane protein YhiD involved in acid resistance